MSFRDNFGRNGDIDSGSVPEDIWPGGGEYPWPDAAGTTVVTSDDANDTDGGTGARTVHIVGIVIDGDGKYVERTETVTMNGTSDVTLDTEFYRINHLHAHEVGSGGVNAGTITCSIGGTVVAQMDPGTGTALQAIWTAPDTGEQWFIRDWMVNTTRQANISIEAALRTRKPGHSWRVRQSSGANTRAGPSDHKIAGRGIPIEPGTDVAIRVTYSSGNNVRVQGDFHVVSTQ